MGYVNDKLLLDNVRCEEVRRKDGQDDYERTMRIPPWERYVLTITEAAKYYHIGEAKLRFLVDNYPNAEFAMLNGNRVLIKRKRFEEFLDTSFTI